MIRKIDWRTWVMYGALAASLLGPFAIAGGMMDGYAMLHPDWAKTEKGQKEMLAAIEQDGMPMKIASAAHKAPLVQHWSEGPDADKNLADGLVKVDFKPKYDGIKNLCYYFVKMHRPASSETGEDDLYVGVCDGGYFISTGHREHSYWLNSADGEANEVTDMIREHSLRSPLDSKMKNKR